LFLLSTTTPLFGLGGGAPGGGLGGPPPPGPEGLTIQPRIFADGRMMQVPVTL